MERRRSGLAGFGLFLLLLGLIWILVNAGIITWSILDALFVLWPLLLVLIGVGIIFRRNHIIRGVAWLVFLVALISYSYFYGGSARHENTNLTGGTNVTVEKRAGTQDANLRIGLGGTRITVDSNTENLLDADLQDKDIMHSADTFSSGDRTASIVFEKGKYRFDNFRLGNEYNNVFHLSSDVIWHIEINTGAVEGNFDLTGLKTGEMDLNIGAADVKLVMGSYNTKMTIKAGASKINIKTPADTGIKVKVDGGINSTNLDEPGWVHEGGYYYSPGYDQKAYRIEAEAAMGACSLSVNS